MSARPTSKDASKHASPAKSQAPAKPVQKSGSKLLRFAVGTVIFAVVVPLIAAWFVSGICMRPPWYKHTKEHAETGKPWQIERDSKTFIGHMGYITDPKDAFGIEYEDVSFPSHNPNTPYTLRGWHVPAKIPGAKVGLILLHGGGHDRRESLRIVPFLHEAGYPLLLYDASEHGTSDGNGYGLGFGFRERMDLLGAVDYVRNKLGWEKITAFGTSVGAVTTIKGAVLDPRINSIIVENPFTCVDDLLRNAIKTALGQAGFGGRDISRFGFVAQVLHRVGRMIPPSFVDLCLFVTRLRVGGWGEPCAVDIIDKISPRPVMLIHSKEDDVVPVEQGLAIFERAKEPKEIWITETGKHAAVYNDYPEEFQKRFLDFVNRTVGSNQPAQPKQDQA